MGGIMFFLVAFQIYQVLWADDGVRLRRALNALLERAYAKRQVGFGWNEFVGSKTISIHFPSKSVC